MALKLYAFGAMIHPYIDFAMELAKSGVQAGDIVSIEADAGAGFVPRLWEPLAQKRAPPSPYAAKFSVPWAMALGFFARSAGLADFSEENLADERILSLSRKIGYRIDPGSEYPDNYQGHLLATLKDGRRI